MTSIFHSSPPMVTPAMRSNALMMAEPSSLFNPAALIGPVANSGIAAHGSGCADLGFDSPLLAAGSPEQTGQRPGSSRIPSRRLQSRSLLQPQHGLEPPDCPSCHAEGLESGPCANFRHLRLVWHGGRLYPALSGAALILSAIAEKLKRRSKDDFKGRHFKASLILQAVCPVSALSPELPRH